MGRAREKIGEKKLRRWKLLDDFRQGLPIIRDEAPPAPEKRPGGPERLLFEEDYFIRMHLMGYADLEEIIALLGVEKTSKSDHSGNLRPQLLPGLVAP